MTLVHARSAPSMDSQPAHLPSVRLFGATIHAIDMAGAVDAIWGWIHQGRRDCRLVVTPNVDHAVMLQERPELAAAYRDASLVLADGWPVVAASRLVGRPVPERVAGSDLAPAVMRAAAERGPLRVYLLGAAEGVGAKAAENIVRDFPNVSVVGVHSPPPGFERDERQCSEIVERINASGCDLLIVGLGAPKQELWTHRHQDQLLANVALCVGATIDFLAGHKQRAPKWMQRAGLEWCHRLASEPRRLAARYARDAWIFPRLILNELLGKS